MPIHDWNRIDAGTFHHFHQAWTIEIANALNAGVLPSDYFAMADQIIGGPIPDVVTLQQRRGSKAPSKENGGTIVKLAPPRARFMTSAQEDIYAARANSILVRHRHGEVVAVIEVLSPGNKNTQYALRTFIDKSFALIQNGVHLLVIDLFPPSVRDPQGIHKAIWDMFQNEPFELPKDKPLTVAACQAGEMKRAYVEPVAAGDRLPSLPIFLGEYDYVPAPLEDTYQATWSKVPKPLREIVENPS